MDQWTSRCDNEIIRGRPPELKYIRSSPQLVSDFVAALFSDDIEDRWPVSIRNILTATLLRFYPEFIYTIEQHPNAIYEDNSRHLLIHSVNTALRVAKVDRDVFDSWCEEVRIGFSINNIMAIPIHLLPQDAVRNIKVDSRSLFDQYNALVFSYHGLFAQKMNLEDNVSQLCLDVAHLIRRNDRMEKALTDQNELLTRMAKALEITLGKEATKVAPAPTDEHLIFFSDSMKRWRKDFSLKDMFIRYFSDRCFEGYELEKNSAEH